LIVVIPRIRGGEALDGFAFTPMVGFLSGTGRTATPIFIGFLGIDSEPSTISEWDIALIFVNSQHWSPVKNCSASWYRRARSSRTARSVVTR
jgi:hypothetical protein